MSRAFVKEDGGEQPRFFALPPEDDPGYDAAAALALLEAARDGELKAAEQATGYRWGQAELHDEVRRLMQKEEERPEAEQDRRFIVLARRFLRA